MSQQPSIGPQRIRSSGVVGSDGKGIITFDFTGYLSGRRGAITRMIAGLAASTAELLRDSFQRVVASPNWGTPDFGPAWVTLAAGAPPVEVNGSRGVLGATAGGLDLVHSPLGATDMEILLLVTTRNGNTATQARALLRTQDVSNLYFFSVDNVVPPNLRIQERVGGVETALVSTTKAGLSTPFFMRFSVVGSTLTATAWNQGDNEPGPDLTVTDASFTSGGAGAGGSHTVAGSVQVDDLVVVPPEAITGPRPTWDAYIGDPSNPANLIDSSQGVTLPRWVPALVNGQPISQGDILTIIASGAGVGVNLVASCYLVTEPV